MAEAPQGVVATVTNALTPGTTNNYSLTTVGIVDMMRWGFQCIGQHQLVVPDDSTMTIMAGFIPGLVHQIAHMAKDVFVAIFPSWTKRMAERLNGPSPIPAGMVTDETFQATVNTLRRETIDQIAKAFPVTKATEAPKATVPVAPMPPVAPSAAPVPTAPKPT